eukprot:CAMPEP_0179076962 /NCGR_PEP_ID=MMETSP0796-20121207/34372_1 /TAXON_ID=73915 /ORGANISM="Pyrodinium bahamense, Strain pbaha01" /LENGTH=196 /DNA_ID=CAMNT_0020774233 /DNA_START=42 /DNA_END=631 /DNA_ORIENTATION=-
MAAAAHLAQQLAHDVGAAHLRRSELEETPLAAVAQGAADTSFGRLVRGHVLLAGAAAVGQAGVRGLPLRQASAEFRAAAPVEARVLPLAWLLTIRERARVVGNQVSKLDAWWRGRLWSVLVREQAARLLQQVAPFPYEGATGRALRGRTQEEVSTASFAGETGACSTSALLAGRLGVAARAAATGAAQAWYTSTAA